MSTGNMSFADKVVLVTGSSSGMGLQMTLAFAKLGAKVVLHGRDPGKMTKASAQIYAISPTSHTPLQVKGDVGCDTDLKNLVDTIIRTYGRLDVLVNNAGIIAMSPLDDPEVMKKFDEQMAINVRAPVLLSSLAAPYLAKTGGNIVNISSGIGMRAVSSIGLVFSKMGLIFCPSSQAQLVTVCPSGQ